MINVIGYTVLEIMVYVFIGENIRSFNENLGHAFYAYLLLKLFTDGYKFYLAYKQLIIKKQMEKEQEELFSKLMKKASQEKEGENSND